MARQQKEWGVYKGDEFLFIGTTKECAERLGVDASTIRFYATPSYKRRVQSRENSRNAIILVDVSD